MELLIGLISIPLIILIIVANANARESNRSARTERYREYLKTNAWQRKRYVVLKRDNWTCQSCGAKATQVHHKKYAKYKIGKEPIKWLVSLCASCHHKIHN